MLYYTPPPQNNFDEVKEKAIQVWANVANENSYFQEKHDRIANLENLQDNFMVIVAMFDPFNQRMLADRLSGETRKEIRDRMIDGGSPEEMIVF